MRFFALVAAALLPVASLASPLLERAPIPEVGLADVSAALAPRSPAPVEARSAPLYPRQDLGGDLGGLLANLTATLHGLEVLLSPDSLNDLELIVTHAAQLLGGNTTSTAKGLIDGAGELLNSPLVGDLEKLLPGLMSVLPKLGGLVNGDLITNLTDIVGNAHALLTPEMVTDTKGLIEDVYPVVQGISKFIGGLLGNL